MTEKILKFSHCKFPIRLPGSVVILITKYYVLLTHKDFLSIECYKSPNNGLTMCVGSYASRADNDVEAIVKEFVKQINFVHLRNVKKVEDSFVESHHLEGDVDMFKVISILLDEQERRVQAGSNQGELG